MRDPTKLTIFLSKKQPDSTWLNMRVEDGVVQETFPEIYATKSYCNHAAQCLQWEEDKRWKQALKDFRRSKE